MPGLMVDVITSLDVFSSAEGWPGLWGMGGPEYFAWLNEDAAGPHTVPMGATTYRLFAGFLESGEEDMGAQTDMDKVVFSATLRTHSRGPDLWHLPRTAFSLTVASGGRNPAQGENFFGARSSRRPGTCVNTAARGSSDE